MGLCNLTKICINWRDSSIVQNTVADHLSGQVIACYLWPALLEAGDQIIFPGEVMCEPESDGYVVISPSLIP